jgi:hypothetical protein
VVFSLPGFGVGPDPGQQPGGRVFVVGGQFLQGSVNGLECGAFPDLPRIRLVDLFDFSLSPAALLARPPTGDYRGFFFCFCLCL